MMNRNKTITYSLSMTLPLVVLGVVLAFALKLDIAYVVAYIVLALECCFQIVGIAWHTVKKDWSVKIIASKVWFTATIISTVCIILTESWAMVGFLVGVGLSGMVNWAGFRFIVKDDSNFIPSIKEGKVKKLGEKMIYRLGADGKPNESEPLCIVEGVAVTPERALQKGYVAEAEKAYDYIRTLV